MTSNVIEKLKEAKRLLQAQRAEQARALEEHKAIALKQEAEKAEAQRLENLFKAAVKDARPLNTDRIHHQPPKPKPIPQQFIRDERQALVDSLSDGFFPADELESGEELLYLREGQSPAVLTKLRRGHWVVQANLDLHGMISDEARAMVASFLAECKKRGIRCVRIVHGKGLGSRNKEPILKHKVRHWLMQKDEVIAYAQARANDGGSGAVIVLLKA
ncbi:Smr/MutS family protein [Candidatus Methylopumilus turicensis]|uniref:Smr protein/MutS2 (Modular protein) n=1 Tax=Candidatus Methylopumilus turicensis TaxID=1581680 RepID=A0A0B7IZ11_9PROT|nr:Smr/MutS family protein [Candidatus Methylopumilus turicensis]CEN55726.1 Smr protein/MutS2 (modular protein) [Candidatus Methylopumilus turicensis]